VAAGISGQSPFTTTVTPSGERGQRDAHGVAGAARRVLRDEREIGRRERSRNGLAAVADDHAHRPRRERARGVEHVRHERTAGERMQHLRHCRMHALALAGGHHDELEGVRSHVDRGAAPGGPPCVAQRV
jgi:hypothetical protein